MNWEFSITLRITPIESFRLGSLLFQRLWDGWHITGPSDDLDKFTVALENDMKNKRNTK